MAEAAANRIPSDSDMLPPGFPRTERDERIRIVRRIREARGLLYRAKRGAPQIDARDARARGQVIVDLWHSGATMAGIARALGIHLATAQKWIRRTGIHNPRSCLQSRCLKARAIRDKRREGLT